MTQAVRSGFRVARGCSFTAALLALVLTGCTGPGDADAVEKSFTEVKSNNSETIAALVRLGSHSADFGVKDIDEMLDEQIASIEESDGAVTEILESETAKQDADIRDAAQDHQDSLTAAGAKMQILKDNGWGTIRRAALVCFDNEVTAECREAAADVDALDITDTDMQRFARDVQTTLDEQSAPPSLAYRRLDLSNELVGLAEDIESTQKTLQKTIEGQ